MNQNNIIMLYLVFLTLIITIQTKVIIIDSSCEDAVCQENLKNYVKRLNSNIVCSQTGAKFASTVSHTIPPPYCSGIYGKAYTEGPGGKIEITDMTKTDDSSKLYIRLGLTMTDIQDQRRCKQVGTDSDYIIRECPILIEYRNFAQDYTVKELRYLVTVKVPRRIGVEFVIIGNPILEKGCDCNIDGNLKYKVELYRGSDCKIPITQGSSLTYGEDVCISVIGDDEFTKVAKFDVTQLIATYSREGKADNTINMMNVAEIKCSLNNVCTPGQIFMILPIINIGRLNFASVIILNEIKRLLANEESLPKGIRVNFPGEYTVEDPYGLYTEAGDEISTSWSSWLGVSFILLLGLLIYI